MIDPAGRPDGPPDAAEEAPAKVNLFLEVIARRSDGYHEIETIMQSVDLCDSLEFRGLPAGAFGISASGLAVPADEGNLALRAARLLAAEYGVREGVHIHLHKRIPVGGGLGGGSSDAAATLRALNRLWGLSATVRDLEAIGAALGSDVNFFLHGGVAVCRSRGEIVEPTEVYNPTWFLLYVPQMHVSTRDIYARLGMPLTTAGRTSTHILDAMRLGEWHAVGRALFNRLEDPTYRAYPELATARKALEDQEALGTLLSGSGSTIFVMTRPESADGLKARLQEKLRSGDILTCRPTPGWR